MTRDYKVATDRNAVIHGDCLSVLPELPARSVDFILTDPPYITRYKSRDGRMIPNDDNDAWLKPAFAQMFRVLQRDSFAVSFYGWPKVDRFMQAYRAAGFRVVGHFAFPKRYTSSTRYLHYQHECAHLLAKGDPRPPEPSATSSTGLTAVTNYTPRRSRCRYCFPWWRRFVRRPVSCSTRSRAPVPPFGRHGCWAGRIWASNSMLSIMLLHSAG